MPLANSSHSSIDSVILKLLVSGHTNTLHMVPSSKNEPYTAKDSPSLYSDNKSMKGEDMEPILAEAEAVPKAVVLKKF